MQEQEEDISGDPDSVLGRVRDIRRKWAVQEDEALAYRLQDEEIAQHYSSNRTRNAIVREDAPKAREAQRQEELHALEERLKHLSILQKQAEEDARLAKLLASRDNDGSKVKRHSGSPTSGSNTPRGHVSPQELLQHVAHEAKISHKKRIASPLSETAKPESEPGPSRSAYSTQNEQRHLDGEFCEEDIRQLQEEKDAAIARALQEELDRYERDKQLALEAQDRELARMLHDKEKARIRRAKEKARLKAESMAASSDGSQTPDVDFDARASSRSSCSSERSRSTDIPPKLPEKPISPKEDHIGFRAHPKPLPPHPPVQDSRSPIPSSHSRLEHHRLPVPDPVPPYMPIHGYNRSSPKRSK